MHPLVLEDREDGLFQLGERTLRGPFGHGDERGLDRRVRGARVSHDVRARGPHGRAILARGFRVDAALEQLLEARVDSGARERSLHERVHGERGEVPLVEDERVPERNGPLEPRVRRDQPVEQQAREGAAFAKRLEPGLHLGLRPGRGGDTSVMNSEKTHQRIRGFLRLLIEDPVARVLHDDHSYVRGDERCLLPERFAVRLSPPIVRTGIVSFVRASSAKSCAAF